MAHLQHAERHRHNHGIGGERKVLAFAARCESDLLSVVEPVVYFGDAYFVPHLGSGCDGGEAWA